MVEIEVFKAKKKELKITFEDLSIKSGIPLRTLENIFHGVTKHPRIDTMQAIERALGLENEKSPPSGLTEGELEWMKLYHTLTDEKKELLVSMVNAFKDMPPERRRFVLDAIRLAGHQK